jgi:serine/threonine protein kinase
VSDARPSDVPEIIGGRYRVLAELGRGNMGRVLKVAHVHTGETLAMKVLFVHRGSVAAIRERFGREARSLAQVRSEHVVRVVDADIAPELDSAPFIVTELLEGEDLARYLGRRGRLDASEVVHLLQQVALGLARVHEAGLVHRDLKPGNIFLHRTGADRGHPAASDRVVVKLLDFGLVKPAAGGNDEEFTITRAGEILGTPLYMSPEQVLGASEVIGPATDIWSVGILAFHLLAGRAYWNLREMPRGVFDIGVSTIRPPSMIDATLSVAFDAWFLRSCARNPAARWPDALTQARIRAPEPRRRRRAARHRSDERAGAAA